MLGVDYFWKAVVLTTIDENNAAVEHGDEASAN